MCTKCLLLGETEDIVVLAWLISSGVRCTKVLNEALLLQCLMNRRHHATVMTSCLKLEYRLERKLCLDGTMVMMIFLVSGSSRLHDNGVGHWLGGSYSFPTTTLCL